MSEHYYEAKKFIPGLGKAFKITADEVAFDIPEGGTAEVTKLEFDAVKATADKAKSDLAILQGKHDALEARVATLELP